MTINAYEAERLANIKRNEALMREVGLVGIRTPKTAQAVKPKTKTVTPKKKSEPVVYNTRRTSSRLSGVTADSEIQKRKIDQENEARLDAERVKRLRKPGPVHLEEVVINDASFETAKALLQGVTIKGEQDSLEYSEKDTKTEQDLSTSLQALRLIDKWDPTQIKITPERIFSIALHPTSSKKLVMAGDKMGHLGMWDVENETAQGGLKQEEAEADEDEEGAEPGPTPVIHQYKVHSRTITALQCDLSHANKVYTSSYDGTIRCTDLHKGIAAEAFVSESEACITSLEICSDGSTMYFSTLDGDVGIKDLRSGICDMYKLHDRKIGSLGVNPRNEKMICTSSLDRTMKVWDFRKLAGLRSDKRPTLVAEYQCPLSVSSAFFNQAGAIVATSFDDTLKIFDLSDVDSWPGGVATQIEPEHQLRHNNQTGRWITVFKAAWQRHPLDRQEKIVVGNMTRKIDILSDQGDPLAQLIDERITAIPAVVRMHDYHNWLVAGNASGKALFFE